MPRAFLLEKQTAHGLRASKHASFALQRRHCPAKNHSNPQKQGTFPEKQGTFLWKQGTFLKKQGTLWNLRPCCLFILRTRRNYHCSSVIKSRINFLSRAYARITLEFYVFCCHVCHSILQVSVKHCIILFSRAFDHMKTQWIAVTRLGAAQK